VLEDKIVVKLNSRKYTPLLRDAEFMKKEAMVPWLGNKNRVYMGVMSMRLTAVKIRDNEKKSFSGGCTSR